MGWVSNQIRPTNDIFDKVVKEFGKEWNGNIGDSHCPYEYFADWLRDNYDLTLNQCGEICRWLKEYYKIDKFYYTECM